MRRAINRMLLGGLLCVVALTSSGCFLQVVLGVTFLEDVSEFVDAVFTAIDSNASVGICTTIGSTVTCQYFSEGTPIASSASLQSELGIVLGTIVDPLILQVPSGVSGVTNVSGTVDDPTDGNPPAPLVITTATSFFSQPGTEIFPEPGHVFLIVDFPASIAGTLTTTGTNLTFHLQFQLLAPHGQFSGGLPVKPMFTMKVEMGGQTFFPPMLPCTSNFASVPSITIPVGTQTNLLPQILGAFSQSNLGCNNVVYDFTSIAAPAADHFQCYEARDRRGSLCTTGSPLNAGAACTGEADCGGIEDDTAFCVPRGFRKGLRVALSDQFESGLFDVKNPAALCNPADKNGEGISDPLTHLRSYRIEAMPGQTPHARRTGIRIQNQFHPTLGELLVDTMKPDRLLVPTATSLTQPVTAPDPGSHDVDHFKCYTVQRSRGTRFERIRDVSILDRFDQPGLVDVVQPTRLCTPVSKNTETIKNPAGHLMCYKVVPVKRLNRFDVFGIFLSNQFGSEHVDTGKEAEFCVPSVKILP